MRWFQLGDARPSRYAWEIQARHPWLLPGIHCPDCDEVWSGIGESYPSVDLSDVSDPARFRARVEERFEEFTRLRESVRPLVPDGATLTPGTTFGTLVGGGRGSFPQLVLLYPWTLLVRAEALERLRSEGVQGLHGCRTELRLQGKNPPELLELQVEPRGLLHPSCFPKGLAPPCRTCGRLAFSFPSRPVLDEASLPRDRDVFRLANFQTIIVATERFMSTVSQLGLEEVAFTELPTR